MTTKKLLPVVLTLTSTFLSAYEDNTYTTRAAVMAITEKNVHGTLGGKNPAHIRSNGFLVSADFLYWKAGIDGLEIATKTKINPSGTHLKTDELKFNAEWRPGLRAGLGWLFGENDQWDLYANWTCFYDMAKISKSSTGTFSNPIPSYISSWSPLLGPKSYHVKGNWHLHYNTIDLEIGRNYFISRKIALRPHVGLRGAWIDLDYKAHYGGIWQFISTVTGPSLQISETLFKAENDFKGIGIRTGADFMWHFTDHFGISSEISATLLYGKFDIDEMFFGAVPVLASSTLQRFKVDYSKKMNRVRTNLEAFLGLFFETGISNDKYHFTLQAGYELSEWFEQNELAILDYSTESQSTIIGSGLPINLTSTANNDYLFIPREGNLGLQGLTLKAVFNF